MPLPDPSDIPISKLLHKIVSALVDRPEFVIIKTHVAEDGMVFAIEVHPDDTGKLIGKSHLASMPRRSRSTACRLYRAARGNICFR